MLRLICVVLSMLIFAAPVAAQSHIELFATYPVPLREVRGTFSTDYEPRLVYDESATGRGTQTLQLDGGRPRGFLAGLNWMVNRHAGVQVFIGRASHKLSGINTPSRVQLTYISRLPSEYIPVEVTSDRTFDWPDTAGEVTLWRVAANGLWRLQRRRVDLTLTGGLLVSKVQGYFDQASYLEFHLGGHSTLFYEEALARLEFDDGWHLGYNVGADVAVPLGARVAVTGGVRFLPLPSNISVVAKVINADQMIFEIPESQVQQFIGTQPARFTRWGSTQFTIGLRFAVH